MPAAALLVVLTGPSGVGKDSLLARLKSLRGDAYFPVNATTRPPRPGEQDGIDYHFLSEGDFARQIETGELLEHAVVYGQHKGVLKAPVQRALAAGQDVLLRTDIQGARYIRSTVSGALTIFVTAPSETELMRRLVQRGADSPEQMKLRLETAEAEMHAAGEFDLVVVNDDLDRTADEIAAIIERERARPGRRPTEVK